VLSLGVRSASAYSVLTHEQLIDLTWKRSIVPLLLSRYPRLTPAELEAARAYAYGGCVIQDEGYYPLGDEFFSNLTHYVRSGDFVVNLFRDAENANELAFAVGALSHYVGDTIGHADATNKAVPIEFPKLAAKYGASVSYAEGEHQHVQTEFAFDINEVRAHHMAPVHYLRHVGLMVPQDQLAKAFFQTYGLELGHGRRVSVNTGAYRFGVRNFIPRIAYAVSVLHRKSLPVRPADPADPELLRLDAAVAAVSQQNDWEAYRKKPGVGTYLLAGLLYVLPKIGPIKLVAIKGPTPLTEADYIHTVMHATDALGHALTRLTPPPSGPGGTAAVVVVGPGGFKSGATFEDPLHPLENRDLDTGNAVKPGGYRLTDETYAELLHRVAEHPLQPVPSGVKHDLAAYYADPSAPIATRKNARKWAQVQADLVVLRTVPVGAEPGALVYYGTD
jgi:hypothetical protein